MHISPQNSQLGTWNDVPPTPGLSADAWQTLMARCVDWGQNPSVVDEDELESPSAASSSAAQRLLAFLHDRGSPPPLRVVADGEGGIVLELRGGARIEEFRIATDGSIEQLVFSDCRLVARKAIQLP
jgi:hypothetical protein